MTGSRRPIWAMTLPWIKTLPRPRCAKWTLRLNNSIPPRPDFTERTAALQAEKLAFRLSECQQRVEKYPTDTAFRFELGTLYLQSRQNRESDCGIPEGQEQSGTSGSRR